ncbi:hypothetical protein P154DRAFT_248899 [Amniculicola lignicola CBS 123094]|uniref:Uncharacterized protein n=1 Tax=Amniculicola lignicola CBS 123094 TaxID=1392246 RepID=A0A6A5WCN8_9PLEO|nr:hypothetical protein P154DRAFT_248899 [Amniculicola lignicola CBS 123094]
MSKSRRFPTPWRAEQALTLIRHVDALVPHPTAFPMDADKEAAHTAWPARRLDRRRTGCLGSIRRSPKGDSEDQSLFHMYWASDLFVGMSATEVFYALCPLPFSFLLASRM